jgi:Ribonuclease G/E
MGTWKKVKRKNTFVRAPALLHRETSLTRGIIRDVFSTKIEKIEVDSRQIYNEICEYLKGVAPELTERVVLSFDER